MPKKSIRQKKMDIVNSNYCRLYYKASGSKLPNPPKIRALDVISLVFSSKFPQIHIISVSGHCMSFIFKSCQTVAGTEFPEFLAGFSIWNHCGPAPPTVSFKIE